MGTGASIPTIKARDIPGFIRITQERIYITWVAGKRQKLPVAMVMLTLLNE